MEKVKKSWYNNGKEEKCLLECPEGWVKGRLPIKDSTRQKHRENNGMKKLTEEQKLARNEKIKLAHTNETEEHRKHKSEAISKAKKGKNLGRTAWNKGLKGVQQAWNKGLKQLRTEEETIKIVSKITETKRKNNSFNTSKPESLYQEYLIELFGEENICCQYSDSRYPYCCDFYVKPLDLFIELNLNWTHGSHPFCKDDIEDINLLNRWETKSMTSNFYKNAIDVWTRRDVEKMKVAKENKLKYKVYYSLEEALNDDFRIMGEM